MHEIHPAFYVDTMTWECRKGVGKASFVIKAKSLSQLQEKLGDEYAIIGYYPKGYDEKIEYPKGPVIQKYSMAEISEKHIKHKKFFPKTEQLKLKVEKPKRVYIAKQRIKVTPEILANMQKLIDQGYSRSAVAERYGISRNAVIGTLYREKMKNVRRGLEEAIPDTSADGALATNGDDRERVPGHERVPEGQGVLD